MNTLLRMGAMVVIAALVDSFAFCSVASAEGWKLPLWRPFAAKEDPPVANIFRRPAPPPIYSTRAGDESTASKMWSGMASGTKKAWNTTVDVVTLKPIRRSFAEQPETGPRLGFKPDPRKSKSSHESPSLFSSWFQPREVRKPSTVDEFFSQERP